MSKTNRRPNSSRRKAKRIPTLLECAGAAPQRKQSTEDVGSRGCVLMARTGRKFLRDDGTEGTDKTRGFKTRVAGKETIRNANRALKKRARHLLKQDLVAQSQES